MSTTVHIACLAAEERIRNTDKLTKATRAKPQIRIEALMSCDTISVAILPPSGAILPSSQFFR
jgi:hypothetical protein